MIYVAFILLTFLAYTLSTSNPSNPLSFSHIHHHETLPPLDNYAHNYNPNDSYPYYIPNYQPENFIGVPPVKIRNQIIYPEEYTPKSRRQETNEKNEDNFPHRHKNIIPKHNNPHFYNTHLQIPCSITIPNQSTTPILTYIDTGAQVSILTYQAAQKARVLHLIDTRYKGLAVGVGGSSRVFGKIPANTLLLNMHNNNQWVNVSKSPSITVLEPMDGGHMSKLELLLGLDSLEEWRAKLCWKKRVLTLRDWREKHEMINGEDSVEINFI